MRPINVSLLALLAFGSSAIAADLPRATEYRAPAVIAAPAFSWTGIYIGANGGYAWGTVKNTAGTLSDKADGAFAGGQIGVNYQSGMWVLGVEGDAQKSWQKRSITATFGGVTATASEEFPWFATARLRAGVAFDRSLLYVTGGGAWGGITASVRVLGITTSSSDSQFAWTAGGGWEWMFADKWSLKTEYLYLDSGNRTVTLFGVPVSGRVQDHIGRFGVNYHF